MSFRSSRPEGFGLARLTTPFRSSRIDSLAAVRDLVRIGRKFTSRRPALSRLAISRRRSRVSRAFSRPSTFRPDTATRRPADWNLNRLGNVETTGIRCTRFHRVRILYRIQRESHVLSILRTPSVRFPSRYTRVKM